MKNPVIEIPDIGNHHSSAVGVPRSPAIDLRLEAVSQWAVPLFGSEGRAGDEHDGFVSVDQLHGVAGVSGGGAVRWFFSNSRSRSLRRRISRMACLNSSRVSVRRAAYKRSVRRSWR